MITKTIAAAVAVGAVAGALGVSLAGGALTASATSAHSTATPAPSASASPGAHGGFGGFFPGAPGAPGTGPAKGGRGFGKGGFGGFAGLGGFGFGGFGGVVHGTAVVGEKSGFKTITFDHGKISALTATAVTITAADKDVETFAVTSTTKILGAGTSGSLSSLKVGETVIAVGDADKKLSLLAPLPAGGKRPARPAPTATPTA